MASVTKVFFKSNTPWIILGIVGGFLILFKLSTSGSNQ